MTTTVVNTITTESHDIDRIICTLQQDPVMGFFSLKYVSHLNLTDP